MIPTFRASGDLVLIDKISSSRLVGRRYRTGDVVIAWAPYDPERMVCKRIAGVAGDVVTIIDDEGDVEKDNKTTNGLNSVGISGVAESGPLLSVGRSSEAGSAKDSGDRTSSPASEAQGVGGTVHIGSPTGFNDNPVSRKLKRAPLQVRVPPGHVWLVGDNAANSRDSRNYGPGDNHIIRLPPIPTFILI
jgi:signal peptidase I